MLETFELFWRIISKPAEAFQYIKERKPLYATITYLFIFGVVSYLSFYISMEYFLSSKAVETPSIISELQRSFSSVFSNYIHSPSIIIILIILPSVLTFLTAGIFSLVGEFFTKRTNGIALFISFTFASVPSLISKTVSAFTMSLFGFELPYYFTILFIVWGIILYIIAIGKIFVVNRGVAIGIFLIPIIVVILLGIVYSVSLFNIISPLLQSIPGV
jgi:hypothetical protein